MVFSSAYSQFNTIRSAHREYYVIKTDSVPAKEKKESFTLFQRQGKEKKQKKDKLRRDTIVRVDTVYRRDTVRIAPDTMQHKTEIKKAQGDVSSLSLPMKNLLQTSRFGHRSDPFTGKRRFHYGTDFSASNDKIRSIMPGKIVDVGYQRKGLGNYVKVQNGDFLVIYGHLRQSIGSIGDLLEAGDIIGISGSTGRSTGEHLHLSVKFRGKHVNPEPILKYIEGML